MKYFKCILFLACSLTSFGQGSWTVEENQAISPSSSGIHLVFRSTDNGDFIGVQGSALNQLMNQEVWDMDFTFQLTNGKEEFVSMVPRRKTPPLWIPMTIKWNGSYRTDVLRLLKSAKDVEVTIVTANRKDISRTISLRGSSTAINAVKK